MTEPTFRDALTFYQEHHRTGIVWGNLHIVLADGNLSDGDVQFCEYSCRNDGDWLGLFLAESLRDMTVDERGRIYKSL